MALPETRPLGLSWWPAVCVERDCEWLVTVEQSDAGVLWTVSHNGAELCRRLNATTTSAGDFQDRVNRWARETSHVRRLATIPREF